MRILILSRKRSLYSTRRLAETARRMGHRAIVLDPLNCFIVCGRKSPSIYHKNSSRRLDEVNVVLPRIGASITEYGLAVVRQFSIMGIPIVNNSVPIARSRDKLRSLQLLSAHDIDIPRTVMARSPSQVARALEAVGGPPVVLKLIQGTQGVGVMLAETLPALEAILDTLWGLGQNILIQEFIAESRGRDIRALVVGGRVVGAMRRTARVGEFRSNIHRGGAGRVIQLSPEFQAVAIKACEVMGLQVAGVDLLESKEGPKVIEINSSPGFEGLEAATGKDIARDILEYAIAYAMSRGTAKKQVRS
jgi:ribosomal protein S6--L-glutamate ligase